ncbi:MAG: hypothetical protein R2796_12145 [Chitinophagaceae bacterium]
MKIFCRLGNNDAHTSKIVFQKIEKVLGEAGASLKDIMHDNRMFCG